MTIAPLFTTAPRIKLYTSIAGVQYPVAYAIGLNISVSVDITPIQVIGKFGPQSLEPTMYHPVSGTLQIQKLISTGGRKNIADAGVENLTSMNASNNTPVIKTTTVDGKEVNETVLETTVSPAFDSNNFLSNNNIYRHMNPSQVLLSSAFSLDLKLKVPNTAKPEVAKALAGEEVSFANLTNEDLYIETNWMRITDIRLASRNTNITIGQIVNEPVSFQGLLFTPMIKAEELFALDRGPKQIS